jgi:DNA-binding response OmpR family regulator/tetratricopeptide (TPR) repeat protein
LLDFVRIFLARAVMVRTAAVLAWVSRTAKAGHYPATASSEPRYTAPLDSMPGYVLIVEANADLQQQIGAALKQGGYELAAETEASWAKRSIAVRSPDVVVLGTKLGGSDGDGFRLAEELRHDDDTRTVPIVFIATTHRGASHRAEARRRFAPAEYLLAPQEVGKLVSSIRSLSVETTEVSANPLDIEATPPPAPIAKSTLRDPVQQREGRDVERSAKHLVADADQAALSGTLKRTPFPRLLQRLYADRASGSLLLLKDASKDATKKIVAFLGGYPIAVRSNVASETLGRILLEKRLITAATLDESVRRMEKEKRQQGQILIEMGALSPYNLERALVEQVEAKLFEIFSWRDGKYMFKAGESAPPGAVRPQRPPAALILEGIRSHYDHERQQAVLDRHVDTYPALSSDPILRLQEMTADPTELAFIQSLDGTRPLDAVLGGAAIPAETARLLLVALFESGMIQRHETTTRRKGPPVLPPPAPNPSGIPGAMAPGPTAPLSSGQLAMMLQTAQTQDYFWVLGVERDAPAAEVDRAYEALARSFHADRYRLASDEDRRTAHDVFERLTEAHRTLRDTTRRRAYLAKLAKASGDEPPAHRPAAPASVAGVPAGAPSAAAARALYETGLEHLRARRHHEAVEALRQAARLVPNEADYRAALGWALFRQAPADARAGRAAVAELRRALQIDERNRNAAQRLAEIYAQTGQPELAVTELERLLRIDPGDLEAAEELRRLRAR